MLGTTRGLLVALAILGVSRGYAQSPPPVSPQGAPGTPPVTSLGIPAPLPPVSSLGAPGLPPPVILGTPGTPPLVSLGIPAPPPVSPLGAPGTPALKFTSPYAVYDMNPPGPPACAPYEDRNGPLLIGDPLLDSPCWAPPGWFTALDVGVVNPHIINQMYQTVGPRAELVHLGTPLDWTATPIMQVGYRFGQGAGELILAYQYLGSSGTSSIGNFDSAGNTAALHSKLDVSVVDLNYASREFSLGPLFDMKWIAGLRWTTTDFHSNAQTSLQEEAVTNNYWGVGSVVGLNLSRSFVGTGLDAFCRFDCGVLYGNNHQVFQVAFTDGSGNPGGVSPLSHADPVIVPRVDVGFGWRPTWNESLHFTVGYTYQTWFYLADNNESQVFPTSRGSLVVQGVLLSAEWKY